MKAPAGACGIWEYVHFECPFVRLRQKGLVAQLRQTCLAGGRLRVGEMRGLEKVQTQAAGIVLVHGTAGAESLQAENPRHMLDIRVFDKRQAFRRDLTPHRGLQATGTAGALFRHSFGLAAEVLPLDVALGA